MKSRRCLSYKLESCANVLLNVPVNCPAIIPKIYRKTYNVIKYIGIFSYFHWTPAITVSYQQSSLYSCMRPLAFQPDPAREINPNFSVTVGDICSFTPQLLPINPQSPTLEIKNPDFLTAALHQFSRVPRELRDRLPTYARVVCRQQVQEHSETPQEPFRTFSTRVKRKTLGERFVTLIDSTNELRSERERLDMPCLSQEQIFSMSVCLSFFLRGEGGGGQQLV